MDGSSSSRLARCRVACFPLPVSARMARPHANHTPPPRAASCATVVSPPRLPTRTTTYRPWPPRPSCPAARDGALHACCRRTLPPPPRLPSLEWPPPCPLQWDLLTC